MKQAVAVDIGGTKTAIGLVRADGSVVLAERWPTPRSGSAIVDLVVRQAGKMIEQTVQSGADLAGVGVGTGGVVDVKRGVITGSSDLLPDWAGRPVAAELSDRLGLAVRLDNDGNTFALAELLFGAGRGQMDGLYVAVGTGIGGGVVLDGRLRHGPGYLAGEFGHMPYAGSALSGGICSCGQAGHVEAVAAGPGLTRSYRASSGRLVANLEEVAALARASDELAVRSIEQGGEALGNTLAGLVLGLDVRFVVVGGGVGVGLGEPYRQAVLNGLEAALPYNLGVVVKLTALGPTAGLIGAGALVLGQAGANRAAADVI
ncbi:MAG: ROK family protein [Bifidobacteriaceae bacterium]|jgi:glucokinase|nr:ROK family protein [Bifidobacteriaceae bacterium]